MSDESEKDEASEAPKKPEALDSSKVLVQRAGDVRLAVTHMDPNGILEIGVLIRATDGVVAAFGGFDFANETHWQALEPAWPAIVKLVKRLRGAKWRMRPKRSSAALRSSRRSGRR